MNTHTTMPPAPLYGLADHVEARHAAGGLLDSLDAIRVEVLDSIELTTLRADLAEVATLIGDRVARVRAEQARRASECQRSIFDEVTS